MKPEGLCFLYQGLQVPEDLSVEVCGYWSRDGNLLASISINNYVKTLELAQPWEFR